MNNLQVFKNSEFGDLSILEIEGKEYFPATSCAKMLGYINPQKAIRDHCKGVNELFTPTKGGTQKTKYIPEGDLYRLIVHSKLPTAEKFERWVFDEVLPAIRKQGNYAPDITAIAAQAATVAVTEVLKHLLPALKQELNSNQIEEIRPEPRPRKHPPGIIDRLDVELRREVEDMLCSGQYTYYDIVRYLGERGIKLSIMSVSRYAKAIFK